MGVGLGNHGVQLAATEDAGSLHRSTPGVNSNEINRLCRKLCPIWK